MRPIRFHHRGALVSLDGATPTRSALDWLREDAHCTGTKEGCAEGDCGACTVVLGELQEGRLALKAVNACTTFLPTLDGKALLTVEDLGGDHPAQQAMVECHGSQCGFCTPGFVMSMFACYERHGGAGRPPTRQQLADELAGNLCRCTGYRPILDAGERMFEAAPRRLDAAPIVVDLERLRADPPLELPGFHAPRTLDALAALRERLPDARLLAGATDIALWVNKQLRELGELIYVGRVDELRRIERRDGALHIGAAATLEDAWRALAAQWPQLEEMGRRFASPPVRNAGTLGGNLANGSPIGDGAPVLMALGAQLVLRRGAATRTLALDDFYLDYMKNRLERGEFVERIVVPPARHTLRAYKISKRFDSDISAVAAGLSIELDADGSVRAARFAYGGMAATVRRALHAERAVVGRPWTQQTAEAAMAALAQDFSPLSDLRASAAYRARVAANLLQRFWLETGANAPRAATSVWQIVEAA